MSNFSWGLVGLLPLPRRDDVPVQVFSLARELRLWYYFRHFHGHRDARIDENSSREPFRVNSKPRSSIQAREETEVQGHDILAMRFPGPPFGYSGLSDRAGVHKG